MMTIYCSSENRFCPLEEEICCCECSMYFECAERCNLELIEECQDFIEEID